MKREKEQDYMDHSYWLAIMMNLIDLRLVARLELGSVMRI